MAKKNYTEGQNLAYLAGKAYGVAKGGGRMPVKPENQESWRAGVKAGKQSAKNARAARRPY